MRPRFDFGEAVRVIRNIRNDGTYPGENTGNLLVSRGSVGYVQNIGTFLQDQIIYSVHFLEQNRVVGCRETELQPEDAPWTPSRFEFREKVVSKIPLSINGKITVEAGGGGEVVKVIHDANDGFAYHVRFSGRTLQVPESVLLSAEEKSGA